MVQFSAQLVGRLNTKCQLYTEIKCDSYELHILTGRLTE